ncbi:FtsH protease activity modulator HflK [Govanella unica]|uniref:Protein HflK n=1 Tax=Govanella unica TaxID=2975056 RepID=A0A9X3TWW2_9PROT|nr:FtsH protease activity modulator HflK [Govania unica]MDA5193490.1 FtsH protease activity modulator HflK [Govania unica]
MPWQNNGGGRNPWGQGPSGRGDPPNLEDLLRRGQDQLKGALPGGFGQRGLMIVAGIVALAWLATGIYTVSPDEQGVVLRFGKYVDKTAPGLHYHLPAPIETVMTPKVTVVNRVKIGFPSEEVAARRRGPEATREGLVLTGDENIVDVEFSVFWKIRDAEQYLFNVRDPERTIEAASESIMRSIIGRTPIQSALTEGRQRIEVDAQERIQQVLNSYKIGVEVRQVQLSRVDPPATVIDAFRDVQAAQADKERLQNEAEAYQNDVIPRARGEVTKLTQDAEAYRAQIVARAQGEASRFSAVLVAYQQAKDVTKQRIYLETMEEILKGMNKIVVDKKAGNGVQPYMPLPELTKRKASVQSSGDSQ